jgi:hypothetical protein
MALQLFMNLFSSNFRQLSDRSFVKKGKTSKEPFWHTFLVIMCFFSVELACCKSSSSSEHSLFGGSAILGIVECFSLDK